jgi:Tol biopolymer transport system component/tRNA A-37 threonylcarbamoyl transferase component Bud32
MTDLPGRLIEALADRYRIERELGAGGMATVYLAEDLKHKRKVAVKVLRPELAAVLGGERFLKEIETTAQLQHPHILPLFDSGEADGFLYYVMPYVEGETLRDQLDRVKQLPVEDAVEITQAVASALDYAHRRGVIHRDIKPGNVLLHDGQALVADFGIAIAVSHAGGSRLTETGLSLGTPHYMSPEQATADREIDGRSDVYGLACMAYEMLVGEPPHTGPTTQAIISRIITDAPEGPSSRRPTVPPNVDAAIVKALAKLPADRFSTAAEFSDALGDASFTTAGSVAPTTPLARKAWRAAAIIAAAAAVVASVAAVVFAGRSAPPAPTHRASVVFPEGQRVRTPWLGTTLSLSADGGVLAYLGEAEGPTWRIWVRRRAELEATPVPGTASATDPALSPDGTAVAFTTGQPGPLKVVSLASGAVRTVVDSARWGGLTWADDGFLYFVMRDGGLGRVHPDGGEVEALTSPVDGTTHMYPDVMPGQRAAVFVIADPQFAQTRIAVADLATGEYRELGPGTYPLLLPTGHLGWAASSGDFMAAPFDSDRLEITGSAVPIVEGVAIGRYGAAHIAVSESGTVLYRRGDIATRVTPVWVARDGTASEVEPGWEAPVALGNMGIALSPDGSRFVFPIFGSAATDLWMRDASGTLTRFTFGGVDARPQWSPDGQFVVFTSIRTDPVRNVWRKRADGSGGAQRFLTSDRVIDEVTVSHDGQWLVYRLGSGTDRDVYAIRPGVDSVGTPLLTTEYEERSASLSPSDRWMAYVSNESGRDEIYVSPFPDASATKWQVSTDGGTEPLWSRDGRELFYRNGNDDLVAVEIAGSSTFAIGAKQVLFSALPYHPDPNHANYDVHPDGRRFLMLRIVPATGGELIWVEHWLPELTALLEQE